MAVGARRGVHVRRVRLPQLVRRPMNIWNSWNARTMRAITSRRWIRPPPMLKLKPRSQSTTKMRTMVHSIANASKEPTKGWSTHVVCAPTEAKRDSKSR